MRYEDLVQDGCDTMAKIYQRLDLGDFELVRPSLEELLRRNQGYQRNRHSLDAELIAKRPV